MSGVFPIKSDGRDATFREREWHVTAARNGTFEVAARAAADAADRVKMFSMVGGSGSVPSSSESYEIT